MFTSLRLHGGRASLVWGYRPIAALTSWRIANTEGHTRLAASITQASAWQCQHAVKCRELLFEAPRDRGRWCWEVLDITVGTNELRATLGKQLQ